jgi:type I restriction enzyme, S subunit
MDWDMSNSTTTRHQSTDVNQWQFPERWKVFQLKDILDSLIDFRGRTPLKIGMSWGGGDIPALSANNVEMGRINLEKETYYGSEALYRKWMNKGDAEEGDILLTMEAPLGNVAQIPDTRKYILSQRTILLKTKKDLVSNGFLKHQLMSDSFQDLLRSYSTGTTATGIQQSKLLILPIVIPPFLEQQKIAYILDTIDNLIILTDRHIAKLKLAKAGLLHDLLTRGIDENGELRDPIAHPEQFKETGTAIGLAPKKWVICSFGDQITLQRGFDITNAQVRPGNVPIISSSGITGYHDTAMVDPPGVVTGRKGSLGEAFYIEQSFWAHDTTLWVKNFHGNYPKFVFRFIQGMHLERLDSATACPTLNRNFVHPLPVAFPDLDEQKRIVRILDTYDQRICEKEVIREKFKLLKKGLVTDLLTGRVRVNLDTIEEN